MHLMIAFQRETIGFLHGDKYFNCTVELILLTCAKFQNSMQKVIFSSLLVLGMVMAGCAQKTKKASKELTSENDSLGYAIGVSLAENFKRQGLEELNIDQLYAAIEDFRKGEAQMTMEQADSCVRLILDGRQAAKDVDNKVIGEKFLAENASKEGVKTTASGLQYTVITEGTGPNPAVTDKVTCHYHGTLIDGEVFDSSYDRGEPATFELNRVIPGWTEGLQLMKEGSKYRFFIPQDLAYGANPRPGGPIKPFSALIFDVELIKVLPPGAAPVQPTK